MEEEKPDPLLHVQIKDASEITGVHRRKGIHVAVIGPGFEPSTIAIEALIKAIAEKHPDVGVVMFEKDRPGTNKGMHELRELEQQPIKFEIKAYEHESLDVYLSETKKPWDVRKKSGGKPWLNKRHRRKGKKR